MKTASIIVALVAAGAGAFAAWLWYRASVVQPNARFFTSTGDEIIDLQTGASATGDVLAKSARLNKNASLWTGVSVGLTAISELLSVGGS